jgi:malate dehydrogenase (oxaloacetate-decarboxylating)(NADP+)
VTDQMFYAAACSLAEQVDDDSLAAGRLYPELCEIREISANIAEAVAEVAFSQGLAGIPRPDDLPGFIRARQFYPRYLPYRAN